MRTKGRTSILGFSILSFEQPNEHFICLLDKLVQFPNARIAIHHDKEQGGEFPPELIKKYGLLMVESTYRTYWSHINNVLATIATFELLFKQAPEVDWFVTITPACYPIKPVAEIQDFYNTCAYDALIDMHPIGKSPHFEEIDHYQIRDFKYQPWLKVPFISKRLRFYWRTVRQKVKALPHPFLDENEPWQGSNWLSVNRKIVERLIEEDVKDGELVKFYKKHIKATPNMHPCPQETVLQTFIANQEDLKIDYNNYRYINWQGTKNWSPNNLTFAHYEDIKKSGAHWARKFDNTTVSSSLRVKIDSELL
jgi:hypothetical protein